MKRYVYTKKRYAYLFALIDIIGYFVCPVLKALLPSKPRPDINRIVVIELAHLGDVLVATPAIRLLRKRFPNAHIAAVVSPWSRDIITGNPDIDEIIIYRASWFDRIEKRHFSIKETINFIQRLRRGNFDLGVDMRCDVRVILLMWLGGVKYRVGYGFTGGGFLLNQVVPFDVQTRQRYHQIDHNINLVRAIDCGKIVDSVDRKMMVSFSDVDTDYIKEYLEENSVSETDTLIIIHLGAGTTAKRWPVEKFALLVEKILERYRVKVVLAGGPEETPLGKRFFAIYEGSHVVNAIGRTNIKQLMALLKRGDLFIGGDSGLMHMASAVETPVVVIWSGQSQPCLWRPLSEDDIVIDKPLKDIRVDDVLDGVCKQLNRMGKR